VFYYTKKTETVKLQLGGHPEGAIKHRAYCGQDKPGVCLTAVLVLENRVCGRFRMGA